MAVPKHRTSRSKRNMRRSHHHIILPKVFFNPKTKTYTTLGLTKQVKEL